MKEENLKKEKTSMGQKVQPLGFRRSAYKKTLGLPYMWSPDPVFRNDAASTYDQRMGEIIKTRETTENSSKNKSKTKPSLLTLSFIRGSFEYGPRPVKGQNAYSKKLHEDFIIEGIVEEFFKKSGYIVTRLFINRNFKELQISVEIFQPLESLSFQKNTLGNKETFGFAKNLDLEVDVLTKFLENFVSSKVIIIREILTFSKATNPAMLQDFSGNRLGHPTYGVLTKNGKTLPIESNAARIAFNILSKALKNYRKEFFFTNGLTILALTFLRPNADLLAKYMALTMEDLPKGQTFIDFIGQGLGALFQYQQSKSSEGIALGEDSEKFKDSTIREKAKIKGILVKVKGRINGSDRSRTSTYRFGSIPLHTIKAAIDYGYSFTKSSYGVSSIKVWFFVEPFHHKVMPQVPSVR